MSARGITAAFFPGKGFTMIPAPEDANGNQSKSNDYEEGRWPPP
jgi:hypothetical protein